MCCHGGGGALLRACGKRIGVNFCQWAGRGHSAHMRVVSLAQAVGILSLLLLDFNLLLGVGKGRRQRQIGRAGAVATATQHTRRQ